MTVLYVEEWRDIVHLETTYQSLLRPRNIRATTSGLCYKGSSLLAALVEGFPYKSLAVTRHSIWQWIQVGGSLFVGSSFFFLLEWLKESEGGCVPSLLVDSITFSSTVLSFLFIFDCIDSSQTEEELELIYDS